MLSRQVITMEAMLLLFTQESLLQLVGVAPVVGKDVLGVRRGRTIPDSNERYRPGLSHRQDKHLVPSKHRNEKKKQPAQANSLNGAASHFDATELTATRRPKSKNHESSQWRGKRFAYEDTHEWPKDDSLEYDFDENGETEETTFWEDVANNWQVTIVRGMFIFSALMMLLMIIFCCLKIWCRVCCQSMKESCCPCGGLWVILTSCYEDPMYKKAKDLAELFGLKLDYATFLEIKDRFDLEVGK